jgi:hypothetical protein
MKLNLFACREGYLLTAECMLPPMRAAELYWPVSETLGVVDGARLPDEVRTRVLGDVRARQCAFVSMTEAFRLALPQLAAARDV